MQVHGWTSAVDQLAPHALLRLFLSALRTSKRRSGPDHSDPDPTSIVNQENLPQTFL